MSAKKKAKNLFGKTEDYVPRFDSKDRHITPNSVLYNPFDHMILRRVKVDREGNLHLGKIGDMIEDFETQKDWELVTLQ